MMNARLDELDVAKGIGMILVVLGHLEPGTYLMRFIYSFSLFLFFTCSGIIGARYEMRSLLSILHSNYKRLIIPYLFWVSVSNSIDVILGRIDIIQAVQNILFFNANVGWNAALWFLIALFWVDSMCAFVITFYKIIQAIVFIATLGFCFLFAKYKIILPFGFYTVPVAMIFWLLGYWFKISGVYNKFINSCNIEYLIIWGG